MNIQASEMVGLGDCEDVGGVDGVGMEGTVVEEDLALRERRYFMNEETRQLKERGMDMALDMSLWDGYKLDARIVKALRVLQFTEPTDIQHASIGAALQTNKTILGAAQTGSGKTFAFGIPIVQRILQAEDYEHDFRLKCIVFTPTRELAVQIRDHFRKLLAFTTVTVFELIGGIAHIKQERVLRNMRPDILVATPGRIYEYVQKRNPHLHDLSGLRYVVLDEADRMLEKHHFAEFTHVLNIIKLTDKKYNPPGASSVNILSLEHTSKVIQRVNFSKKEKRVIEKRKKALAFANESDSEMSTGGEGTGDESTGDESTGDESTGGEVVADTFYDGVRTVNREADPFMQSAPSTDWETGNFFKVCDYDRQFYVYSATLSLEKFSHFGHKGKATHDTIKGMVSSIKTILKTLDLGDDYTFINKTTKNKVASRLDEFRLVAPSSEKDYYLFYLLLTHPGKSLIFVNSIDCLHHIVGVFRFLNLDVISLHAKMPQPKRLKNITKFTQPGNFTLIATDVAARGLDIPQVDLVIHYQVARSSDIYVHRSGRTARGHRIGKSVLIVNAEDYQKYKKIRRELDKEDDIPMWSVDYVKLKKVKARVNLAKKIDTLTHKMEKEDKTKSWWKKAAQEADILVDSDDDLSNYSDDDESYAATYSRSKINHTIQQHKEELKRLLSLPI